MIKKVISITLIVSLIFTTTNIVGLKVYAQGIMTNSSTVIDFDAIQNAVTSTDDTDNDGVYDEVEKILGLNLNSKDTDGDGLDDYFELTKGLDPLKDDTNDDGVNDMYEVTRGEDVDPDITLDTDADGNPNVFDDDNDNDGIVDYIDISPFASMGATESQEFEIQTNGNNTFVNIQIRPSDVEEIIEYGRSMTWPEDVHGQVQNIDDKKDNFNITPYLKISETESGFDIDDDTMEKYGYIQYGDSLYIPIEKLEYDGNYIGYQGTICLSENSGESYNGKYINTFDVELSYLMTIKNDYLGQGMHTNGRFSDYKSDYEPIVLEGFDETRDRQFLNSAIGDIGNDNKLDLAVFYLETDDVDNGIVSITYDVYPWIYERDEGYSYHGEPLLNQTFEINTGFTSVNKEDDGYIYMSRYDFDIVGGEIVCFYIDGREIATVYKATANGTIIDTGIEIENGQRHYFTSNERFADFYEEPHPVFDDVTIAGYRNETSVSTDIIGSNITDGAGYYVNDTFFYLYSKESESFNCDSTYLVVKEKGEPQKEIVIEHFSNLPTYKYSNSKYGPQDGAFADTELSTSLDIYDVTQDGKDDLVMLSYGYGTNTRTEYSELYFISDIFGADLDDYTTPKKLEVDIASNEGYARSMDIADIDYDGFMDMVIINANKEIEKQYLSNVDSDGEEHTYCRDTDNVNLNFSIDASYTIISREEILLSHETEFEITGVNIESQNKVDTIIFSHEEDELMLGVAQAFEYEFVGTGKNFGEALDIIDENMGLDEAGVELTNDFNYNFDNYDDALASIGEFFDDALSDYKNETRSFVLGLEKKYQYKNLDELAVINENDVTIFDVSNTDTITTHEMSFKWIIDNTLASPEDIIDMVDDNDNNITYFDDYNEYAKNDLERLNIGSTNITQIGDSKIELVNEDYEVNSMNPVYLSGKVPSSGISGFTFIAKHSFASKPASIYFNCVNKVGSYPIGTGYMFKSSELTNKLAKFNKFKMVGNAATGVGFVVDVAFSCYNGYMYGQALKAKGASDSTVAGAQTVYSVLYSAKALFTTTCMAGVFGPFGYVAFALIMADMLLGMIFESYDSVVDKAFLWIVKNFYDYEVYEGTYISTFDIEDKDVTSSANSYFTWVNDTYNEYTTYKTIISAKDKDSPANTKKKLDDCWVQIYDELESDDAIIDNDKSWTEDFYKYHDKWRQKRYFHFDNTVTFDEVGRNVLIENDVVYKYKIIEKVTVEKDEVKYDYSDKDKVYKLNSRDMYFDILPTSFEVFFEIYELLDGTYEYVSHYDKNQLGCTDIDGDGLFVDEDGNEIDDEGNVLTSDSDKFDTDDDKLSDYLEASEGSDPTDNDSDNDGLTDFEEFKLGTSLTNSDTDGDGVNDYTEVNVPVSFTVNGVSASGYSSPLVADTDGDLLSDLEERIGGTNPASLFTYGGELYDGNSQKPILATDFEDFYSMTDGEELTIDLNNHIIDDNDLIFVTDYGTVDENGILTYIYDKNSDGTSFEISITASDSRNGILETSIMLCEDMDNPFIIGVKLDDMLNDNIIHIDKLAENSSEFEIIFNEEVYITSSSAITITPIENEHLDVDSNGVGLSKDCTAKVSLTTSKAITITRDDGLIENNITYRIDINNVDIEDTNGNLLDRDYEITFKMEDNIVPEVISVSNAVGIDSPLIIEFNEPIYMKPNTYYSNGGGGTYVITQNEKSVSGYIEDTTFIASIKPNYLDSNITYTLDSNTNKFWDTADNVFAGFDGVDNQDKTFTTSDVVGPYPQLNQFTLQSPVPQIHDYCFETDIIDGEIRIPFDEIIMEGIDYSSIALSYENNLYFYGSDSAEEKIAQEAKKYTLPYTSIIEDNTLVIVPENYNPTMNYSVFIEPKSIIDLSGSYIRDINEDYRLRILAKSEGVSSTTQDNSASIVALYCTNNDMSKSNIVSNGLNESAFYTDYIRVVFNQTLVQNPFGSLDAITLEDENNYIISCSNTFVGLLNIVPDTVLSEGEYTITIPSGTLLDGTIPVGQLTYIFTVENEIDIEITEDDVAGIFRVDEKVFLTADYLQNVLSQDKNVSYQWYSSDDEDFSSATPIGSANSYEYTLTANEEGKYIFVSVTNGNVFEISPAMYIDSAYNSYCDIYNITLEYDETNLINYDSNTYDYDLTVSAEKDKVYVSADFDENKNMNVNINGIKDTIWAEEGMMSIGLMLGDNEIIVESVAENKSDTKTYTINIFRDETLGVENLKPSAKNVSITNHDDNYVGSTLYGNYEYYDELNRQEGESELKWYKRKDNQTHLIAGANSYQYEVTSDDVGYRLMFSVTPKTETDVTGDEISSNYTDVVTDDEITYTVTFEENGGSIVSDITDVNSGSTIDEPTEPTRSNYTFIGWYSDGSLTTLWDFDNDLVADNITLYARWDYTPSSSGGSSSSSSSSSSNDDLIIPESKKGDNVLVIVEQDDVEVTFNGESFTDLEDKTVEIKIEETDKDDLNISDELKEEIGDLLIFDISIYVDDKKTHFESDKPIEIKIEIDTDLEEHKVIAVYIDENGDTEIMEGVLTGGVMHFTTYHLSDYALMYIDKSFEDITNHWGKIAVEALASREIVKGKSNTVYDPDGEITRAEFVTLMVRCFDLKAYGSDLGYTDIESGSWYEGYVWTAREVGLLPEIYGDTFEPNKAITREEMMYILYKSLEVTNKLDNFSDNRDRLSDFTDSSDVSEYVKEKAEYLVSRDIINGNNNNMISPTNTSSRAEVAQMLWNMINMSN